MKKIIWFLIFCISFIVGVGSIKIFAFAQKPLGFEQDAVFEIHSGDNLYRVIKSLNQQQKISCYWCARAYLVIFTPSAIVPGEYETHPEMNFSEFLTALAERDILQYKITFIEGWTLEQALQALWAEEKIANTLEGQDSKTLLEHLDFLAQYRDKLSAEGLFFPATYHFSKGMSDRDVLYLAFKKMQSILEQEWQLRDSDLPYSDVYESLIMASIIEKETGVNDEREEIAGVFVRRLKIGMLLQTDPTVIYGMGKAFKGNIRRRDLLKPTAYNTYVNGGLPPTPIALAGRKSIHAALNPKPGKSLYFVADGEGGHIFSNNLREHNRAVKKYLRKMRKRAK